MPKKPVKPVKREPIFPSANTAYNQIKDRKAANQAALDELDDKPKKKK